MEVVNVVQVDVHVPALIVPDVGAPPHTAQFVVVTPAVDHAPEATIERSLFIETF